MWEKHVKKLRDERNKLYAPPKFYEKSKSSKNSQKLKQNNEIPPPEAY